MRIKSFVRKGEFDEELWIVILLALSFPVTSVAAEKDSIETLTETQSFVFNISNWLYINHVEFDPQTKQISGYGQINMDSINQQHSISTPLTLDQLNISLTNTDENS